jgi:flagellum-specific peptidoglycan hydrolase FlgJ
MIPKDFISTYENAVIEACGGSTIFPSVKMAQAALETGWGKSVKGNNMFGIKGLGKKSPYWTGKVVNTSTREVINGQSGQYNLDFRAYETVSDSIRDHTYFLQQNSRYANAGVFTAKTPEEQCKALQNAGYATDPNYAQSLISIITKYNLKRLDEKKKS